MDNFLNNYEAILCSEGILQEAFEIQSKMHQYGWSDSLAQRYERLCEARKKAILKSDKTCRKLWMGEVPWSRTLQFSRTKIHLWTVVQSQKKGTKVSTRFISRLEKQAKITNSLQHTLPEIMTLLCEEYKRYYELKKIAHQLRE